MKHRTKGPCENGCVMCRRYVDEKGETRQIVENKYCPVCGYRIVWKWETWQAVDRLWGRWRRKLNVNKMIPVLREWWDGRKEGSRMERAAKRAVRRQGITKRHPRYQTEYERELFEQVANLPEYDGHTLPS